MGALTRLAILLAVPLMCAQQAPDDVRWAPLKFMVGDWVGEGTGQPGEGKGGFSFRWDLQNKVLVRKNHADYSATANRPAFSHEDLMVVYADAAKGGLQAIYFDSEGHVINYAVTATADQNGVEFLSAGYRLTYRKAGANAVTIKFEVANAGKPDSFSTYIEAKARRITP